MKYCPNCGSPVKADEKYCFRCGTKILQENEPAEIEPIPEEQHRESSRREYSDVGAQAEDVHPYEREEVIVPNERERISRDGRENDYKYSPEQRPITDNVQRNYVQQKVPVQQPQPIVPVPLKPRHHILSTLVKILEVFFYLGLLVAIGIGIIILYNFANGGAQIDLDTIQNIGL